MQQVVMWVEELGLSPLTRWCVHNTLFGYCMSMFEQHLKPESYGRERKALPMLNQLHRFPRTFAQRTSCFPWRRQFLEETAQISRIWLVIQANGSHPLLWHNFGLCNGLSRLFIAYFIPQDTQQHRQREKTFSLLVSCHRGWLPAIRAVGNRQKLGGLLF